MHDLVFALNSTMPVFLVILLGYALRRLRILDAAFCRAADRYVFRCALPVSLFKSISELDLTNSSQPAFLLFCFAVTTVMFFGSWGLSWLLLKDRTQIGAFAQASVRSSAAILGVAFAVNIYGNSGMVPMMVLASVPFFNAYSVIILSFSPQVPAEDGSPQPPLDRAARIRRALFNVVTNPIIIGILLGVPFALLHIQLPTILSSAVSTVGGTATPVALLVIGANFSGSEALTRWKPAAAASFVKLFLLPALVLPAAIALGFRQSELIAILIMAGAPTTVSAYIMAKEMRADSVLTSNCVVLSTLLSSVSITLWLFVLRSMAMI